jgi:hypothetical protein
MGIIRLWCRLEQEKRKLRERERPKAAAGSKQSRTNLANIRVVQPNLVYAVGLGLEICHEEVLKESEFFGQFGKSVKVSCAPACVTFGVMPCTGRVCATPRLISSSPCAL